MLVAHPIDTKKSLAVQVIGVRALHELGLVRGRIIECRCKSLLGASRIVSSTATAAVLLVVRAMNVFGYHLALPLGECYGGQALCPIVAILVFGLFNLGRVGSSACKFMLSYSLRIYIYRRRRQKVNGMWRWKKGKCRGSDGSMCLYDDNILPVALKNHDVLVG